MNKLINYLIN